jgi:hypothetical protein
VIVTDWAVVTAVVVIVKVTLLPPAGMLAAGGTLTFELLDESVTCTPPVGAGLARVTVPVRELPPVTDVDDSIKL